MSANAPEKFRRSDVVVETPVSFYYGKQAEIVGEEREATAKTVGQTHFVRRCAFGMNAGHLYNPLEDPHAVMGAKAMGDRQAFTWEKVTHDTFNTYLDFLRTRQVAKLRLAERAALNGD